MSICARYSGLDAVSARRLVTRHRAQLRRIGISIVVTRPGMNQPRHLFSYEFVLALCLIAAACGRDTQADTTDISGAMPPLSFSMTRANDSVPVNALSYRGKVVLLYFGYTHCPDECPTMLANLAIALKHIGSDAKDVRVLFVTVDPARDSIAILKKYVNAFAPQIDGLRGSDNAIAALARRYRVLYSVTPAAPDRAYEVMHADSLFMFDRSGRARLVTMSTQDARALAAEIKSLG